MEKKKTIFTCEIDVALASKMQEDLEERGFIFSKPPYTIFSAQKNGVSLSLYKSGKLVVQGKEIQEFIEFYLEPEILKKLVFSHPEIDVDMTPRIGVDEAGKGDFFGPLCVAAFYGDEAIIKELIKLHIKDSKMLSDSVIKKLAAALKAFPHTVIRLYPYKYNELYSKFHNLNTLLGWGHATVIEDLQKKTQAKKAIIDQFAHESIVTNALKRKKVEIDLTQRHKGEEDIVVAAASILARNSFLEGLELLGNEIAFILPKGASSIVKDAAHKILKDQGKATLEKVSKTHFKTFEEVLNGHKKSK